MFMNSKTGKHLLNFIKEIVLSCLHNLKKMNLVLELKINRFKEGKESINIKFKEKVNTIKM